MADRNGMGFLPTTSDGTQDSQSPSSGQPEFKITLENGEQVDLLRSIDTTLKYIYKSGMSMSQSSIRSSLPGRQYDTGYSNDSRWRTTRRGKRGQQGDDDYEFKTFDGHKFKGIVDEFEDGLREALMESIVGANFKGNLRGHLIAFEKQFGVNIQDIPKALGKSLMKDGLDKLKGTTWGQNASKKVSEMKQSGGQYVKGKLAGLYTEKGEGQNNPVSASFKEAINKFAEDRSKTSQSVVQDVAMSSNGADFTMTEATVESTGIMIDQYNLLEAISTNVEIVAQCANQVLSKMPGYQDIQVPQVKTMSSLKEEAMNAVKAKSEGPGGMMDVIDVVKDGNMDDIVNGVKQVGGSIIKDVGGEALGAVSKFTGGLITTAPQLALLAAGAAIVAYGLIKSLGPAIEGTKQLFEEMKKSGNRYQESRKKNLEEEEKRLLADVNVMVEKPFEILTEAAEAWYKTWDENLRTINATQGYNKDDLYSLMGTYADRLRSEGLTGVVSSADISSNLAKVLESGLSGEVAEEFAYIATILESAVPTQDWFSYGETYASIAANAIKDGQSQSAAIQYANEQMELFASNVLYASRQLSGGFSSGLKDAQSLFEASNNIAVASKSGNVATISGVLTSVSAVVGAIAPDLASGLVDAVVSAATGGNSSEIVALRSLAGVNASNTEFLKLLAQNPQGIFEELFKNLAKMQNMSNDNYMEVAEGLAEVFGISMDAFARIDFNYLADAISQMSVNNSSLKENIELLASGETTTNAELLRYQQINQYMLDEGLSYVMDNEAARAIQENMWAEQRAREMMEAEYAVNLQGSALTFLEGLSQTVQNILDFLNPLSFLKKITNLLVTAQQADAQRDDLRQLLELGKVGSGNAQALYNLTTTGQDLHLTKSLNSLMGGYSKYEALDEILDTYNTLTNFTGRVDLQEAGKSFVKSLAQSTLLSGTSSTFWTGGAKSKYSWDTVSKSASNFLSSTSFASGQLTVAAQTLSASAATQAQSNSRMQEFIDSMEQAAIDGKTYSQWKSSASSYGIKDVEAALDEYGLTEQELKNQFSAYETQQGAIAASLRNKQEEAFWEAGQSFWTYHRDEWGKTVVERLDTQIVNQEVQIGHQVSMLGKLDSLYTLQDAFFKKFFIKWEAEFETHSNYNSNLSLKDVQEIQSAEKDDSKDAILALAKAITDTSIDLKDPQAQTNALLAKILLVAEAIMQQNNQGSAGASLATTLQGLSLGLTTL